MGVVIRFPKCRPLTELEHLASVKARFFNDSEWKPSEKGNPYIWVNNHWVMIYQRKGGGWSWGHGVRIKWYPPTWSPKVYGSFEIARKKAWLTVMHRFDSDDDPFGIGDDGDAA